ncbi:MAG: cupin domain-containing protein [Flavobacteriales bacterium]|jgi:quercetin dioxygenase-like cupin family protein|nr:cupin domain-containing protein [Flavobacteriales bacterium]
MDRKRFLLTSLATGALAFIAKGARTVVPLTKGYKVASGETRTGEHFKMRGVTANTLDMKVGSADTDGGMAVFEQIGESRYGGPPLHIHPQQDEFFHVLEGEYRFQVGDQRFMGSTGDLIFLPRGVPHAFIQLSEPARMLVVYQPAGDMEGFFRETATWTAPPAKDEVARVFAAHGMEVVGPPLTPE